MEVIAGGCVDGTCPTIYRTERGTVVVQGQLVNYSGVTMGEGEALVEIPADLLKQANA
jgi:formylmethanofuran dehydrogenase subunit C